MTAARFGIGFSKLQKGLHTSSIILLLWVSSLSAQEITYISPLPGSSDVSQQTNLIIRTRGSIDASALPNPSDFSVEGSQSGVHAGRVVLSDDAHSLIFQPLRAFNPGERVTVAFHSNGHLKDGSPLSPIESTFGVSAVSSFDQQRILSNLGREEFQTRPATGGYSSDNVQDLAKISSDTIPPSLPVPVVTTVDNPSQRQIFLSTFRLSTVNGNPAVLPTQKQYLMIVDVTGKPLFYKQVPGGITTDFKLQPYTGYLTYYDANRAAYYELDSTYAVIDSFKCGNGYQTDDHELLILPNGHFLLLGSEIRVVDMSAIVAGGKTGANVIGDVLQELDKNQNVVFQWRSLDYFKITDATHEDLTAATIDADHANAIEVDTDGNLLLSSRHLDEITKINRQTGNIIWRMGGKNNQFTFTNDPIQFSHQHSIRRTPQGTLILYDDGNFHSPQFSRAVEYSVDEKAMTATQVWQYRRTPDIYSFAMGSVQRLPNGNTLIGWGMGLDAAVTEVRPNGSVALELRLPDSVVSYRAWSYPWQPQRVVTEVSSAGNLPSTLALAQNYPNPFNPSTLIQFSLPQQEHVQLEVYDVMGRVIGTLVDEAETAGTHSVRFDASRYASGVYFYRLSTPGKSITKMMTLIK